MRILLALGMLVAADEPPFRATMRVERTGRAEDRVVVATGTLTVKPGHALLFVSGASRTLIRGGRAVEHRAGEKAARGWDPGRPEHFQPLDLWRISCDERRRLFHESEIAAPSDLPDSVRSAAGRPVAPVPLKLPPGARIVATGASAEPGWSGFTLVPREAELRRRIPALRIFVEAATRRLVRVELETAAQKTVWTLSEVEERPTLDDSVFSLDLVNVTVEER